MIRLFGLFMVSAILSACALSGAGPVATNAHGPMGAESGVGGTGFVDIGQGGDEGVGGTGLSFSAAQQMGGDDGVGGTGIFGIISAFGSIVVNGVHIDYEAETPVSIDGKKGTPADFAIGQLVAVEADPMGERYQARLVEIQHAVVGPVSDVDKSTRTITVLGQLIEVPPSDRLPGIGEWVRVSGLRDLDEHVVATRIDPALPAGGALVRGVVQSVDGDALVLGRLRFSSGRISSDQIRSGDEVLVRGQLGAQGFTVWDLSKAPSQPFGGRMRDLLIEGYMTPVDGGARVSGHRWLLPMAAGGFVPDGSGAGNDRAPFVLKGVLDRGDFHFERLGYQRLLEINEPMPRNLDGELDAPNSMPDLLRDFR